MRDSGKKTKIVINIKIEFHVEIMTAIMKVDQEARNQNTNIRKIRVKNIKSLNIENPLNHENLVKSHRNVKAGKGKVNLNIFVSMIL